MREKRNVITEEKKSKSAFYFHVFLYLSSSRCSIASRASKRGGVPDGCEKERHHKREARKRKKNCRSSDDDDDDDDGDLFFLFSIDLAFFFVFVSLSFPSPHSEKNAPLSPSRDGEKTNAAWWKNRRKDEKKKAKACFFFFPSVPMKRGKRPSIGKGGRKKKWPVAFSGCSLPIFFFVRERSVETTPTTATKETTRKTPASCFLFFLCFSNEKQP